MTTTPDPDVLTATITLVEPSIDVRLDELLIGRTFTHLLTAAEIERDVLPITPDFAAYWPIVEQAPFDLINGRPFVEFDDEESEPTLRLEPGTLAGFAPGSLIGIRAAQDGLYLSTVEQPDPVRHVMLIGALTPEVSRLFGDDAPAEGALDADTMGSVPLEEFLALACLRDPQAFTEPTLPVTDLLEDLGLDHDTGSIALSGFDFAAEEEDELIEAEQERIAETYELADNEAAAVLLFSETVNLVHDAVHNWMEDGADPDAPPDLDIADLIPALDRLSEPMVCVAIADENLTEDPHLGEILTTILESLQGQVPRRAMPGWHWLRGRCADLEADFTAAEAGYSTALDLDPDFYPAMRELATLASLRGDAGLAVSLLHRAAVPTDDPELAMVVRYVGESRSDVGRNDPCWCGSGKKYKRCHLGRSDFDLAARRDWLYEKVSGWVRSGRGREVMVEMAQEAMDPADPQSIFTLVADPLVMDLTVFEGGLLEEFLAGRAVLLPDDEQELLLQWAQTRRGLYTVENLTTGTSLTLRSDDGEPVEVTGPTEPLTVGDVVTAHLLPAGGTLAAPGGVRRIRPAGRALVAAVLAQNDTDEADPIRTAKVLLEQS